MACGHHVAMLPCRFFIVVGLNESWFLAVLAFWPPSPVHYPGGKGCKRAFFEYSFPVSFANHEKE